MRFSLRVLLAGILFFPLSAAAFLNDSDPTNYFLLLQQAPLVLRVKVEQTQNPTAAVRYFLHSLKVQEALFGKSDAATVKVLQEVIFPKDRPAVPNSGEVLVMLAPLPHYTSYAAVRSQGAAFRLFGGALGVLPLNMADGQELLRLSKELLESRQNLQGSAKLEKFKTVLLQAMNLQEPRWLNEAALALGAMEIPKNFFTPAEISQVLSHLRDVRMQAAGQRAVVMALKESGAGPSLEALQKLADGDASPAKWAAVRALEELGMPRSTRNRIEDFARSDPAGKEKALALVMRQQDADSKLFLKQLLSGSEALDIKREAIDSMARIGGVEYEQILLEQMNQGQEPVAAQAILALGRMQSREAVPRLIQLLESPSPLLRSAAMMALQQSNDPRALKVIQEKTEEGGVGHTH